MKKIYLDNSATTPVAKEVVREMNKFMTLGYGNASSIHEFGRVARDAVENSRKKVAKVIGCRPDEIIFTSGGTESDNLAIKGLALANPGKKHIITSRIEHPAVIETCKELEKQGYTADYVSVDSKGVVDIEEIDKKIKENTLLVSIMHVNNEIGAIQPIEKIAEICRRRKVYFHTDAVQSFGKIKIESSKLDLLSASGHKINGPKGIGILYVKSGIRIKPILSGGGQEHGKRSGTENVPGIVGFGKAAELAEKNIKNNEKVGKLRDKLLNEILEIPGARLNGGREKRIFNNINVSFKDIEGESLLLMLDKQGIAVSTGSACSSHSLEPSHVLKAIGLSDIEAHGSLRITLGYETKEKDVAYVLRMLKEDVKRLRGIYSQ